MRDGGARISVDVEGPDISVSELSGGCLSGNIASAEPGAEVGVCEVGSDDFCSRETGVPIDEKLVILLGASEDKFDEA